ncbi:MAG: twin-arginine translocase TatA/TatE family subunit [Kiritimatiellia bacterium]|nr:twin-arginine translocase TatA/TatE family subunit [Kiritimatiellia bacterium]
MNPIGFLAASPSLGEMAVVFLAFLLLFGAKKIPEMARGLGRMLSEFRRATREVQDELMRADLDTRVAPEPIKQVEAYPELAEASPDPHPEPPPNPPAPTKSESGNEAPYGDG